MEKDKLNSNQLLTCDDVYKYNYKRNPFLGRLISTKTDSRFLSKVILSFLRLVYDCHSLIKKPVFHWVFCVSSKQKHKLVRIHYLLKYFVWFCGLFKSIIGKFNFIKLNKLETLSIFLFKDLTFKWRISE